MSISLGSNANSPESSDYSIDLNKKVSFKLTMKQDTPYLYGQFNNWQPQPMISVAKFAEVLHNET